MSQEILDQVGEKQEEPKGGILGIFESRKARDAQRVVELTEKLAELDEENTTLHEEVAKLHASEKKLSGELEKLQSDYEAQIEEIEALKKAVESADESAGQKAAQIAAQNHVAPGDLPAASSSESENLPASTAELEEALRACKSHSERSKLLKQYKNRSNN